MHHFKCILLVKKDSTICGHFIAQVHNTEVKWSIKTCIVRTKQVTKALRQKWVEWIMKYSKARESPIVRDTLLITDAEYEVKRRVPKLLQECSMWQFHNDLIASPDDGGLLGSRHANKNDMIISDKMIYYLAPSQLLPITDHQKMICGYAISNTLNYFQESLNAWQ